MSRRKNTQLRRQKVLINRAIIAVLVLVAAFIIICIATAKDDKETEPKTKATAENDQSKEKEKTKKQDPSLSEEIEEVRAEATEQEYPAEIIELLDRNPETVDYVANYGEKKDDAPAEDIGADFVAGNIPTLFQWDERWGYTMYGPSPMGITGCGPTCLSMVLIGVTGDPAITPDKVAAYSTQQGFITEDSGSLWQLMSDGARNWGVQVSEAYPGDEEYIKNTLQSGAPIICSMQKGTFTDVGHFIVLTSYEEGYVTVHDPFRKSNSHSNWKYADIMPEISACWSYSK